jgi:hypothetical protein
MLHSQSLHYIGKKKHSSLFTLSISYKEEEEKGLKCWHQIGIEFHTGQVFLSGTLKVLML